MAKKPKHRKNQKKKKPKPKPKPKHGGSIAKSGQKSK